MSHIPFYVVFAAVLGVSQAWTWPYRHAYTDVFLWANRRWRLAMTYAFLWLGWLAMLLWHVVLPWYRS